MRPDRWQRVRELFPELVAVPAGERGRWLDERCAGDQELRGQLERLIVADQGPSPALEPLRSVEGLLDQPAPSLAKGTRIGQYELQELIAVGGTGAVWRAEQLQPRRVVALKALRAELSGPDAIKRFRAEAEILGHLRHPGIAQVYEAGTAVLDGRVVPYLALEHVGGSRDLVSSCNERRLDRRERLRLFVLVCDAVHHGHQRGVIHRDLKPGNVLVDPDGRPKVIDFGLARVLAPDQLNLSLVETRSGELLGTLAYMSPEHVSSSQYEVDARSDIYSLGCILLELLAGRTPFDLANLSLPGIVRRILEDEPSVPRDLPADLRWILGRCLEKDAGRRYPSASELAADVLRYLAHEPVLAGPPSRIYRWKRFARRHRAAVLGALGVSVALVVGLIQARSEARAARQAEGVAKQEKEQANLARAAEAKQASISTSAATVLAELLTLPSPFFEGSGMLVSDAIRAAEGDLPSISDPTARAIVGSIVAHGLMSVGERPRAGELLEGALPTIRANLVASDPLRLQAEVIYADFLEREERFGESIALSEELLPTLEGTLGAGHPQSIKLRNNLGAAKHRIQDWTGALAAYRTNLEIMDRSPDGAAPSGARVDLVRNIGSALAFSGRREEGRGMLEEALSMARVLEPADPQREGLLVMDLGIGSSVEGQPELALESYREAARLFELDPPDASTRFALEYQTAAALYSLGRLDEAAEAAQAARAVLEASWSTPQLRAVMLSSLECNIASGRGDHERVVALASDAIDVAQGLSPPSLEAIGQLRSTLSRSLLEIGRADEAAREAELAHGTLAEALGAESRQANLALERWVLALLTLGETARAAELAQILVERTAPDHSQRAAREELLRQAQEGREQPPGDATGN